MNYIILKCDRDHLFIVARVTGKSHVFKTVSECPDWESANICYNAFKEFSRDQ